MQKCYQIYKLVSLVRYKIITWISVCMNKKLLQNRVVITEQEIQESVNQLQNACD